jgi:preprotein translocase subunit SecB
MAEQTVGNGAGNGQDTQPQLNLQKIYVKDASFEAPNAPQVFQDIGTATQEPQVQLNIGQKATKLGDNVHEVVLSLTLTCTLGERTAYLAEVHQAGVFGIAGFPADDEAGILASYCPNLLFPYARQVISSLVLEGGFPPFLLQPINFDALYAEQQRRLASGEANPALNGWAFAAWARPNLASPSSAPVPGARRWRPCWCAMARAPACGAAMHRPWPGWPQAVAMRATCRTSNCRRNWSTKPGSTPPCAAPTSC